MVLQVRATCLILNCFNTDSFESQDKLSRLVNDGNNFRTNLDPNYNFK